MKYLFLCIAFLISFDVKSMDYVYTNIVDQKLKIRLRTEPVTAVFGEHSMVTKLCGLEEKIYCVESDVFVFGVPNSRKGEVNQTWKFKKNKKQDYYIFGEVKSLEKIDFFDGKGNLISYWVSEKKGIQWIYIKTEDDTAFFILQRICGFGAPLNCTL